MLLEHDYVIIPQLGGFVAKNVPSEWCQEEELFLPPYRSVHFNPSLNHGDSAFVESLAKAYSVTPAEAEKWVAQFVQTIRMELLENGLLDFGSIGVMIQESPEQPITFSPCKAGVTTPSLYGLDSFHMPMLAEEQRSKKSYTLASIETKVKTSQKKPEITRHYTLRINRRLVHSVAALAASIILFVLFATPINTPVRNISDVDKAELFIPSHLMNGLSINEILDTQNQAEEPVEIRVKEEPLGQATTVATENEMEVTVEKPAVKETSAPAPKPAAKESATVTTQENNLAIVLASAISIANAEAYAQDLQSRGYDAHVYQKGNMVRVIIPSYDNETTTRRKLKEMKQSGTEFKHAWITTLK